MYQRADRRQQFSSTNINSPYFTTAGHATSPSHPQTSNTGYGYSQSEQGQSPYYGNDTSYAEVSKFGGNPGKHNRKGVSGGFSFSFLVVYTLLLAGCAIAYIHFIHLPRSTKEIEAKLALEVEDVQHELTKKLRNLQKLYDTALQQRDDATSARADAQDSVRRFQNEAQQQRDFALDWERKFELLEDESNTLKRNIQESDRRKLLLKYGPGPYSVELEVSLRGAEDRSQLGYMTLELSPDMPHTVFTFLEQVDGGLYNFAEYGFGFNGPHITQALPLTDGLAERFQESGVSRLLFPEYSPRQPHEAYTVGLAGRPGGPNIYINVKDNSHAHGPGGFTSDGRADPCFGRITRGQDIVDRINAATGDLQNGDWKKITPEPVILSIKNWSRLN